MTKSRNPHRIFFDNLETSLNAIESAEKYKSRSILLAHANLILKQIEALRKMPVVPKMYEEGYKVIEREMKSYLIKSAYVGSEEDLQDNKNEKGSILNEARLIERNTNESPSKGMSLSLEDIPEKKIDTEPLSIPHDIQLHDLSQKNIPESDENALDKSSVMCDNPFTIEDFAIAKQQERETTLADLITQVDQMIDEVEEK